MKDLSWQSGLILVGCAFIALILVGLVYALWRADRRAFIPYQDINKHRITPSFRVGSDVK